MWERRSANEVVRGTAVEAFVSAGFFILREDVASDVIRASVNAVIGIEKLRRFYAVIARMKRLLICRFYAVVARMRDLRKYRFYVVAILSIENVVATLTFCR